MEDIHNPALCILPFMHLNLMQSGAITLCCCSSAPILQDGRPLNIRTHSLKEAWESAAMREIRARMLRGECVPQCLGCYHLDRKGLGSHRSQRNGEFLLASRPQDGVPPGRHALEDLTVEGLPKPTFMDVRFENLCNLRCVMCHPTWSSGVERDPVMARWHGFPDGFSRVPNRFGNREDWVEAEELFPELVEISSEVTDIQLAGGEPFINKLALRWLRHLGDTGQAAKIRIMIFTNFLKVDDACFDLLAKFKEVNLTLSIDATGPVYEYIRYPGRWETIERNAERLRARLATDLAQVHVSLNVTLSIYNAFSAADTFEWAQAMGFSATYQIVSGPPWIHPSLLPARAQRRLLNTLEQYVDHPQFPGMAFAFNEFKPRLLEAPDPARRSELMAQFMLYTNDLDRNRNGDFKTSCHDIYNAILREYGFWPDQTLHST